MNEKNEQCAISIRGNSNNVQNKDKKNLKNKMITRLIFIMLTVFLIASFLLRGIPLLITNQLTAFLSLFNFYIPLLIFLAIIYEFMTPERYPIEVLLSSFLGEEEKESEGERLERLFEELNPAVKQGLNYCVKCGFCCHRVPCIPTYQEFLKISDFLNLTPKEALNRYFVVDLLEEGEILFAIPAGANQLDYLGKFLPVTATRDRGKCIFLDDNNRCKIYPARPRHARIAFCFGPSEPYSLEHDAIQPWEPHQDFFKEIKINWWDVT